MSANAVQSPNQLTIEQLAAETGMSVRNIRAHQARGLLEDSQGTVDKAVRFGVLVRLGEDRRLAEPRRR
ncbi:MAG: MerR family transcriptional regulator [Solirubrobacteraceae bacterium]